MHPLPLVRQMLAERSRGFPYTEGKKKSQESLKGRWNNKQKKRTLIVLRPSSAQGRVNALNAM